MDTPLWRSMTEERAIGDKRMSRVSRCRPHSAVTYVTHRRSLIYSRSVPINPDEEASRVQYKTPLTCPDCKEHIFETSAILETELDFLEAQCTSCGYALNKDDIFTQMKTIPSSAMQKVIAQSAY